MTPGKIHISLTPEQAQRLAEHFAHVNAEASQDRRGMLVAQVYEDQFTGAHMIVGFIPHTIAKTIEGMG